MEEKKTTSMKLKPYVLRELKILAATTKKGIGDVIEALVKFQKMDRIVDDADWVERFQNLWETALINSGDDMRGIRSPKEYRAWLLQLIKIGKEQGDEAAMRWLKENPYKEPTEK